MNLIIIIYIEDNDINKNNIKSDLIKDDNYNINEIYENNLINIDDDENNSIDNYTDSN